MAGTASSSDGDDCVSSSSEGEEADEEEARNAAVRRRITESGAYLSLAGEDLQWVPPLLMHLAPLSISGTVPPKP